MKILGQPLNQNSRLGKILKAVFLVLVIGLLVNLVIAFLLNSGSTLRALGRIRWSYVAVPFAAYLATYIIDALRLRLILWQFKVKVPFCDLIENGIMGGFFSNITPFAGGGQPYQVYHLRVLGVDLKRSASVIASRWVESLVTSLIIVGIAFHAALNLAHAVGAGAFIIILGFGVSFALALVAAGVLFRPDLLARVALKVEHSPIGRVISRVVRKREWGEEFVEWSLHLKAEVGFLWREKLHIMIVDTLLGFTNLLIQVLSLWYVIEGMTGARIGIARFLATFVTVNLVAYLIPTPGGSGSIEGIYSLVFSGLTGRPDLTFIAVVVWRFAGYYLQVLVGLVLFMPLMRRVEALARAGGR